MMFEIKGVLPKEDNAWCVHFNNTKNVDFKHDFDPSPKYRYVQTEIDEEKEGEGDSYRARKPKVYSEDLYNLDSVLIYSQKCLTGGRRINKKAGLDCNILYSDSDEFARVSKVNNTHTYFPEKSLVSPGLPNDSIRHSLMNRKPRYVFKLDEKLRNFRSGSVTKLKQYCENKLVNFGTPVRLEKEHNLFYYSFELYEDQNIKKREDEFLSQIMMVEEKAKSNKFILNETPRYREAGLRDLNTFLDQFNRLRDEFKIDFKSFK